MNTKFLVVFLLAMTFVVITASSENPFLHEGKQSEIYKDMHYYNNTEKSKVIGNLWFHYWELDLSCLDKRFLLWHLPFPCFQRREANEFSTTLIDKLGMIMPFANAVVLTITVWIAILNSIDLNNILALCYVGVEIMDGQTTSKLCITWQRVCTSKSATLKPLMH